MRTKDALLENYASHYARLNSRSELIARREIRHFKRNYMSLLQRTPATDRYQVLDVGCATGRLLATMLHIPGIVPVGVDVSSTQTVIARTALPNTEIACEDAIQYLRKNRGRFSGIICNDVIEHLDSLDACVELVVAARYALVPGGFFSCRTPNGANLFASYSRYMDLTHERCFTSTSLLQTLEAGGLDHCESRNVQAVTIRGAIQTALEHTLHLGLFYLTARTNERHFQKNVVGVGFAPLVENDFRC